MTKDKWIKFENEPPKKEGKYLCVVKASIPYREICDYSLDLYKTDRLCFYNKANQSGFYTYDGVFDHYMEINVSHWMELPDFPEV